MRTTELRKELHNGRVFDRRAVRLMSVAHQSSGENRGLSVPNDRSEEYALEVSERIVLARKEAGLTQVELAELIDVSQRSMQGYENAEVIPYRKMRDIARVLNKPVEWLLHGDEAVVPAEQRLEAIERQLQEVLKRLPKK